MKKIIVLSSVVGLVMLGSAFLASAQTAGTAGTPTLTYSQDANVGAAFVLDGSKSQDDQVVKTFTWTQVDGPQVTLSDVHAAKPTFTPGAAGTYVFELTVVDNNGVSSVAQKVTVIAKGESSDSSTERVLPTVNKVEDNGDGTVTVQIGADDQSSGEDTSKVLPTVNKVTGAEVIVRGWDPSKKESIEGTVNARVEEDDSIKSAEVAQDSVKVVYAAPAKLFGIFNIKMNTEVDTDADGKVTVKFPWYRFLVSTKLANAKDKLEYVFQHNQTDMNFLKAKGSVEAQTGIFLAVTEELQAMSK